MPNVINKIVKTLIISDFFLNSGWGLMGPIFSIFIVKNIALSNISEAAKIAGFAALVFWITKSLLQIPIGRYLDKNHGEKDDFWFMVVGTFMMAFVPLGYLLSSQAWHIYALQIFYAIAASINFPSWSAIFTRHIDDGREAFEWGTHSTVSGLGVGIAGGIGGIAVAYFGFSVVFLFVSGLSILAGCLLFLVRSEISPENEKTIRIPIQRIVAKP
jgi:predicted MFS family arabinose efflux permease